MSPSNLGPSQGLHVDGTIDVQCWCGKRIVRVDRAALAAGKTRSCGAGCRSAAEVGDLKTRALYGSVNRRQAQAARKADGDQGFRGPTVCRLVGITYRQLDYWARTNLVCPSIADAKGSGTQRRYSYRDLIDLKTIKALLDAGVSLQSARRAIEYLRKNLGSNIASARLVLNGPGSVLVHTDAQLIALMRRGQGVFSIVDLGGVLDELNAAVIEMKKGDAA